MSGPALRFRPVAAAAREGAGRALAAAGLMLFALLLVGLAGNTPPETAKSYTVICGLRG